jgi:hypothetical protein
MQTELESLEQAYISLINLREEGNRENSCLDTYCREEIYCALSELTKAIVLMVIDNDVCPSDKRVYVDITENNTVFSNTDENTKSAFLNALYDNEVLIKEKTVGDLIEELKRFSPSLKVSILGERNKNNKVVVDDTYLDKIILVGVEH